MKKAHHKKDDTGIWKRVSEQVVGQLFFPDVTTVDTYKLQFTEVTSMDIGVASKSLPERG